MRPLFYTFRTQWLPTVLILSILCAATLLLLKPFYDSDFFWHLKTGEWIWQHGRLPDHDPFNFNTSVVTPAIKFTLTSYWFSQVVLYLAFLAAGFPGVVALRFLVSALLIAVMTRRLHGDRVIVNSLLLFFTILILNFYFMERPQTYSFLYFAMLLHVIERIRQGTGQNDAAGSARTAVLHALFCGLVMLLWANSHGGYLIGQGTLLLFILVEGSKFLHPRLAPLTPARYLGLLCAALTGLACSFINPNTWQIFQIMASSGAGDPSTQIQEYASMPEFYNLTHTYIIIAYLAAMFLTGMALILRPRKLDLTDLVLLSILGYFAFMHVRYAAFFLIAALPVLARSLSGSAVVRWGRMLLPPLAICCAVYSVSRECAINTATARSGNWVSSSFPEKAADFIVANNVQGTMYNEYEWGGYLIWRLAPGRRVFSDGRNFNAEILLHNYLVDVAQVNGSGEKVWKSLLQKYGITYVVARSRQQNDEVTPLANALMQDAEWVPVFSDRLSRSVIFVKSIPANSRVIASRYFIRL